jgi:polyisoprenoid-binding protein YceI
MKTKITATLFAAAAMVALAFTTPTTKQEKAFTVNAKKTTAAWLGTKVTGKHNGNIQIASGKLITSGNSITGGTITFDMNSITNIDMTDKEWNDKLVGHLKSDDFFGVEKFPTAQFEITKTTLKSGEEFDVAGKLTIKGITQEIRFPAIIKVTENLVITVAKITVDRTKFDIKFGSASFFESIGDKAIDNNFVLDVNVVAEVQK